MKLKPRTTFKDRNGNQVMIAGLTGDKLEGLPLYWSIQGNHYARDGRFVSMRRLPSSSYLNPKYERYLLKSENHRTLISEDKSTEAKAWWNGVVTAA